MRESNELFLACVEEAREVGDLNGMAESLNRLSSSEALRAGQGAFSQIAAQYNGLGAGRGPESEAYLRRNIVYDLGEEELSGLREFYRRARALALIDRVPELRFHGHR